MVARAKNWLTHAVDAVLPPHCPITGEPVDGPARLSPAGWLAMHFVESPYCGRCGVPFAAHYGAEVECPSCIAVPPAFDRARAAIVYNDASHKMVVQFKHSDRTDLAPAFARWMRRAGAALLDVADIIAPVPLHPRRLWLRRYNQSALLAQHLSVDATGLLALDLLERRRATAPQKNLSEEARRRNVRAAFAIKAKWAPALRDARVVLIDDVLTTGATLSACASALKSAGAASVDALVLARVVKGGLGAI